MPNHKPIDPHHIRMRTFFRVIGPLVLLTGVSLMLIGFADVACTMGNMHRTPTLFWCFMLGMPVSFAGLVLTNLGYMGRMHRYISQETTPVQTDTFNYAARHTKDGVRELAQAIGEGLRGETPPASAEQPCTRCLHKSEPGSRFCSQCGTPLDGVA